MALLVLLLVGMLFNIFVIQPYLNTQTFNEIRDKVPSRGCVPLYRF